MTSTKKFNFKKVLIIILAVLMLHCALSMVVTKVVYDSIFDRYDPQPPALTGELEELVSQRQEVFYEMEELQLAGYLYRSSADTPRSTLILLSPGFHAGGDDYLWQIHSLLARGWSVFSFDPSGSCSSEGDSYQGFPQQILDLDATLSYIEANGRFGYDHIALLGHSRGGYAAGCILGYGHQIDAVVTISGVNSAMDGIMGYSTEYVGPLAYGNYGFLWAYQSMLFGSELVDLQAHEEISKSDVPVLVVHGSADEAFPTDEYSIYAHRSQINRSGVEYLLLDQEGQNGHTDLMFQDTGANERLMDEISRFLENNIP